MNSYAKNIASRVDREELKEILEFNREFSWLSNFYWHYSMLHTVEHVFQAAKAGDQVQKKVIDGRVVEIPLRNTIMRAKTPGKAKQLGRRAKLPSDWDTRRIHVMKDALIWKFNREPLREWLLATGDIFLEEGNTWHDNFWGNCRCDKCNDLPGTNMLGLLLMEIRNELLLEDVQATEEKLRVWHEEETNAILDDEERRHRGE
jgi:ribA/ribD-fused uncharacterized protein